MNISRFLPFVAAALLAGVFMTGCGDSTPTTPKLSKKQYGVMITASNKNTAVVTNLHTDLGHCTSNDCRTAAFNKVGDSFKKYSDIVKDELVAHTSGACHEQLQTYADANAKMKDWYKNLGERAQRESAGEVQWTAENSDAVFQNLDAQAARIYKVC